MGNPFPEKLCPNLLTMLEDRYSIVSQRQIKKMKSEIAKSIIQKIDSMRISPLPIDAIRCKEHDFRESVFELLHLGHRILYELNFEDNVLLIHNIEKKEEKKKLFDNFNN